MAGARVCTRRGRDRARPPAKVAQVAPWDPLELALATHALPDEAVTIVAQHRPRTLQRRRIMTRLVPRIVGLVALLTLLATGTALADAGGQGTVTVTQQFRNVPLFSMPGANPCTGEPGTFTATARTEVFHATFFTNGDEFWVTGTAEGLATFTPDDPHGVSASGHFATWFGESANNRNDVQHDTGTFVLNGSDGSHVVVHMANHLSTNANGVVTVAFSNLTAHCG
jgi:hypothetical protein